MISLFSVPRRKVVLSAVSLLVVGVFFTQAPIIPAGAKPNTPAAAVAGTSLEEEFSFEVRDLPVRHQGGNTLGVTVHYAYIPDIKDADYPDFRLLAQTCEAFLTHYPQDAAFWEIVNKQLTQTLLEKFPALADVTVELHVAASSNIPYARTSTVTRHREGTSAEK